MQRAARHTAGPPLPFLINKKEFSIMEQTICVNAPLALAGTRNTRELGGYPAACGRKTRRHAFLRSDGLSGLTDKDVQMLLDYGVCCVVDLRSESETAALPPVLQTYPAWIIIPSPCWTRRRARALRAECLSAWAMYT